MLKRFLKNQRGLTLVELLAVIVILGIIAAIAVPSVGGIISKSKEDAKVAEAIQVINAAKLAHASKQNRTVWTHEGTVISGSGYNPASYKYGPALKEFLDNVKDKDYTVVYENNQYIILGHDAANVINSNATATTKITEQQLTGYTE